MFKRNAPKPKNEPVYDSSSEENSSDSEQKASPPLGHRKSASATDIPSQRGQRVDSRSLDTEMDPQAQKRLKGRLAAKKCREKKAEKLNIIYDKMGAFEERFTEVDTRIKDLANSVTLLQGISNLAQIIRPNQYSSSVPTANSILMDTSKDPLDFIGMSSSHSMPDYESSAIDLDYNRPIPEDDEFNTYWKAL